MLKFGIEEHAKGCVRRTTLSPHAALSHMYLSEENRQLLKGARMSTYNANELKDFDFMTDMKFEDLKDIRENDAYRILAEMVHEDESVWREENGWSLFTHEYKQRILDNVGQLMALQMRSIVEKSVEDLEKFLLSFQTLRRWKRARAREQQLLLQQQL